MSALPLVATITGSTTIRSRPDIPAAWRQCADDVSVGDHADLYRIGPDISSNTQSSCAPTKARVASNTSRTPVVFLGPSRR